GRARRVFGVLSHSAVSPAVVAPRKNREGKMWYVDAGPAGCGAAGTRVMLRRSTDDKPLIASEWSHALATDLHQPDYVVWHLDVHWIPKFSEFWAVYAAYPADGNGCGGDDLFFARSADGIHWTEYPSPIYRREDRSWTSAAVYRSSFQYDSQT